METLLGEEKRIRGGGKKRERKRGCFGGEPDIVAYTCSSSTLEEEGYKLNAR